MNAGERGPGLDGIDRLLIDHIQKDFPLTPRPFLALAEKLNEKYGLELDEDEVLARVDRLKGEGYIRRLGAIFEARALGYQSTLCAARVAGERLEAVAEAISASPAVTHNYLRDGEFNIWFTFTGRDPAERKEFLESLASLEGVERVETFPAEKIFKLKVDFRLSPSS